MKQFSVFGAGLVRLSALCLLLIPASCETGSSPSELPQRQSVTELAPPAHAPWWVHHAWSSPERITLSPDGSQMAWSHNSAGEDHSIRIAPTARPDLAEAYETPHQLLNWTEEEGLLAGQYRPLQLIRHGGGELIDGPEFIRDAHAQDRQETGMDETRLSTQTLAYPPALQLLTAGRGRRYQTVRLRRYSENGYSLRQTIGIHDQVASAIALSQEGLAIAVHRQVHPGGPVHRYLHHPFGDVVPLGPLGEPGLEPLARADRPEQLYALDQREGGLGRLVLLDLPSQEVRPLTSTGEFDHVFDAALSADGALLAVYRNPERPTPVAVHPAMRTALSRLAADELSDHGDIRLTVSAATQDRGHILFRRVDASGDLTFIHVDTTADTATPFRFNEHRRAPFSASIFEAVSADGHRVPAILLTPLETREDGPLVVSLHGGPMSHDLAEPDFIAQTYLEAGLRVLTVNYRGSTGYGPAYERAGDLAFDAGMIDDVLAAIDQLPQQDGFQPVRRILLSGSSFGGHLAMAVARARPAPVCFVTLANPATNLVTFQELGRPYLGASWEHQWRMVYGRWYAEPDASRLLAASAVTRPDDWNIPIALIASEHDVITPVHLLTEFADVYADVLVEPMIVLENVGHSTPPNSLVPALEAVLEQVLSGPCSLSEEAAP